jgi:hypothetical protein
MDVAYARAKQEITKTKVLHAIQYRLRYRDVELSDIAPAFSILGHKIIPYQSKYLAYQRLRYNTTDRASQPNQTC